MPLAVTHVLLTIIVIDLFRDHFIKDKKLIPLKYLFIGGIASLLPDIDIPIYWFLNNILKFNLPWFHRTFSHTIFFPLVLIFITIFFFNINRKWFNILSIITFAVSFHLLLDAIFGGIMIFYPLSQTIVGFQLDLIINMPAFTAGMDAIILLAWLWHEEKYHKISDFI